MCAALLSLRGTPTVPSQPVFPPLRCVSFLLQLQGRCQGSTHMAVFQYWGYVGYGQKVSSSYCAQVMVTGNTDRNGEEEDDDEEEEDEVGEEKEKKNNKKEKKRKKRKKKRKMTKRKKKRKEKKRKKRKKKRKMMKRKKKRKEKRKKKRKEKKKEKRKEKEKKKRKRRKKGVIRDQVDGSGQLYLPSYDCGEFTADFQFYLLPIAYSLAMAIGLLGNLGALYIFLFKMEQKSPSNVYIISLAVADTLFLCALPFRVHYHLNKNNWVFGDVVCRVSGTVFYANIYISIAFMTCICLDRYIATIHPHTYLQLRNTRCAQLVTAGVWVVTGAATLTFMLTCPLGTHSDEQGRKSCFENFSQDEWMSSLVPYSGFSLVFGALLPSMVILVCYPLVARRIARIKTATARGALRVIYAILAITVLCFLPYHVVHLLHLLLRTKAIKDCTAEDVIYKVRRVTMALVSMNSVLDPMVYYFATGRCKWSFKWNFGGLKLRSRRGVYTISEHLQARW
ncbi:hypothetical protein NFI96_004705 [Prochilodus magdalenae]|nr:hypothetical protein NFI96_004705 [Prochilodus magdalenae]